MRGKDRQISERAWGKPDGLTGITCVPECIHTASMSPEFIYDIQVIHPFSGAVDTPQTGAWRDVAGLALPEAIVEGAPHTGGFRHGRGDQSEVTWGDRLAWRPAMAPRRHGSSRRARIGVVQLPDGCCSGVGYDVKERGLRNSSSGS